MRKWAQFWSSNLVLPWLIGPNQLITHYHHYLLCRQDNRLIFFLNCVLLLCFIGFLVFRPNLSSVSNFKFILFFFKYHNVVYTSVPPLSDIEKTSSHFATRSKIFKRVHSIPWTFFRNIFSFMEIYI